MSETQRLRGVLAPAVTPFREDLSVDAARYLRHCRWLLSNGCDGLAVLGTNSEANSLSVDEREQLLHALVEGGIAAGRLVPGTGGCALPDTVRLTAIAARLGCAGALVLPPFYYKAVSDDGLYRSFAEVVERVGDRRLRLFLYHIPQVAGVGLSVRLIERLRAAYGSVVAGIKDSSGDFENTKALHAAFGGDGDFDVFVGSEVFLLPNLRAGGAGCITASANVSPGPVRALYQSWRSDDADLRQQRLSELRAVIQKRPMIPALKAIIAHHGADPGWRTVRPPLVDLGETEAASLIADLDRLGFTMPGLRDPNEPAKGALP